MWKDSLTIKNKSRPVHFYSIPVCLTLALIFSIQTVHAQKKMYRWVDERGRVFISDRLPPDQVKHKRESLNKNIRVIKTTEKEKSKEQQALARRLAKLRRQQEKIIQRQNTYDKVLLSTYRSVEDMAMALKGKLLGLDGKRKIVSGNLEHLEKQLQKQQKQAAQFERDGLKVPVTLVEKITASKDQIEQSFIEISSQFEIKKRFRESFEADIARFAFLTKSGTANNTLDKAAETKAANELGLFVCESVEQCDTAWEAAKTFVDTYATTPLDFANKKLIISLPASQETELSLSVSKLSMKNNKQQLFLDIQCHNSFLGKALCNGKKVKKIRHLFNGYIQSALKSPATLTPEQ